MPFPIELVLTPTQRAAILPLGRALLQGHRLSAAEVVRILADFSGPEDADSDERTARRRALETYAYQLAARQGGG